MYAYKSNKCNSNKSH